MKRFLIVASFAALAACGSNDADTVDATATPTATAPAQTTGNVTAAAMAGTYEVTMPDGKVTMQTLNADGTYVDRTDGTETDRGTWRQQGDQLCYAPNGGTETCYAGGQPGPDGAFEMRDDAGNVASTVRKVDATPTA